MKFSYLNYEVYKKCPLQYKWRFVEKPDLKIIFNKKNAFIGFVLQKIVERFYKEKWWQRKDLKDTWRNSIPVVAMQFTDSERIQWNTGELEEWLRVAHDSVDSILKVIREEKLIADPSKNKMDENLVEHEIELPLNSEDALQGRPDFLIRRNDIVTLLDGKGGKTVGKYVDKDQLHYYSGLAKHVLGRLPHRAGFWWFRHAVIKWYPITHDVVDGVQETAKRFISLIKEKKFDATPGQHCRFCDYRIICETGQTHMNRNHIHADVDIPNNFGEVSF